MFRHHLISSIDFNHHQLATSEEFSLGDASLPKVRIDDAMSPIRDERHLTSSEQVAPLDSPVECT